MARVTITPVATPDPDGDALAVATPTAADASNKNQCVSTGREIIFAYNSGASSRLVTISSVACSHGRTGDITATVPAGELWRSRRIPQEGFRQTDGYIYFEAAHAEILFAVVQAGN